MNLKNTPPAPPSAQTSSLPWRIVRRATIVLACLITLVALFYAEEDWRGKHAWERCKAQLQAKGDLADWSSLIPPPLPDDQNFYKAPGIDKTDWTGRGAHALSQRIAAAVSLDDINTNSILLANLKFFPSGGPAPSSADATLNLDDPNASAKAGKIIANDVGPTMTAPLGFVLAARLSDQIRPLSLLLTASRPPTADALALLFSNAIASTAYGQNRGRLQVESTGDGAFRLTMLNPEPASDYLARTQPLEPVFDTVRAAAQRPYARMDGDYQQPYSVPVPNFVLFRALAQTLATRAKGHVLLGDPDAAVRDLTLIHDLTGVLDAKPTGGDITLLQAMIDVAINGLYADTIADAMRLGAWREPQLAALQRQLAEVNLIPTLVESFRDERVSSRTTIEQTFPASLALAIAGSQGKSAWRAELDDPLCRFLAFAPRGWAYQNMVAASTLQPLDQIADVATGLVYPNRAKLALDQHNALSNTPYTFLLATFFPNATRAWKTLALNQTKIDLACVACALARFRLAHTAYPDSLESLVPQYIETLPRDIIGGQSLHYSRAGDASYLLYSVGWNQTDDHGQIAFDSDHFESVDSPDYVWIGSH